MFVFSFFGRLLVALAGLLAATTVRAADDTGGRTIAIIGDSTVCDYPSASPMRGWGQMLPDFLPPGVRLRNEARPGLSTRTFPRDRWESLLALRPHAVLIQFGHNDSHAKGRPESTDAATDFRDNLRRFIREAREAGTIPVLVTPVRRRLFREGRPTAELAPYAEAMKAVADEEQTLLVDLHAASGALYERLGEEGSTALTINQTDHADRPGQGDRTHFTETGAREIARLVAGSISRAGLLP